VTVAHPFHPLHGRRLEVIAVRRSAVPDLVVRLPDGSAAAVARSLTSAEPVRVPAPAAALPLVSPVGLRQLAALVAARGRARQGPGAAARAAAVCQPADPRLP
jgi:hypothetical protein